MIQHIFKNKLLSALLTFALLTTSFGGAIALPASAATPDAASEGSVQDGASKSGVLAAIAAVGLIAVLAGGGSSGDNSSPPKGTGPGPGTGQPGGTSPASLEQQALTLLNNDRAANGLPALRANSQLTLLARNYAQDMINRGFFAHTNPEGQSPFDRMQQAGISYKYAGENLAANANITSAEAALMNSSGHRANILSPNYTEVGIGVARTASGSVYVVQEFIGR